MYVSSVSGKPYFSSRRHSCFGNNYLSNIVEFLVEFQPLLHVPCSVVLSFCLLYVRCLKFVYCLKRCNQCWKCWSLMPMLQFALGCSILAHTLMLQKLVFDVSNVDFLKLYLKYINSLYTVQDSSMGWQPSQLCPCLGRLWHDCVIWIFWAEQTTQQFVATVPSFCRPELLNSRPKVANCLECSSAIFASILWSELTAYLVEGRHMFRSPVVPNLSRSHLIDEKQSIFSSFAHKLVAHIHNTCAARQRNMRIVSK